VAGCYRKEAATLPEELNIIGDYKHAIFERDSQMVVERIYSCIVVGVSKFSGVISNIIRNMSLFSNLEVKFDRRQTDMIVHTLAMTTISLNSHIVFEIFLLVMNTFINVMSEICFDKKNKAI
jgi:hypothetical protein